MFLDGYDFAVLSCATVGEDFLDEVRHGVDALIAGSDFGAIRDAIIATTDADDDLVARQCRYIRMTCRPMVEPPDYESAWLPSVTPRAAMGAARRRLNQKQRDSGDPFGGVCIAGHLWIENAVVDAEGVRHCRTCKNASVERSARKYPEKMRSRAVTRRAIRSGVLVRRPCEVCGDVKVDAHHDDYTKPLSVRWLCRKHHARQHHDGPAFRERLHSIPHPQVAA